MPRTFSLELRNPSGKVHWSLLLIVAVLICALSAFALRPKAPMAPPAFGKVKSLPQFVSRHKGSWFWLEMDKQKAKRLVSADGGGLHTLAEAEELSRYAVSDDTLVWSARQGKKWTLFRSGLNGREPRSLWSGDEEPLGLNIVQGRIFWVHRLPAPLPDSGPFSPLLPTLEILALSSEGGVAQPVGRIPESEDGEILGGHDDSLYVITYRNAMPVKYCIYRVPMNTGAAVRVVGEAGRFNALLTREGSLYWIAHSSEVTPANSAACIKRLDKAGKPETLTDWLPGQGRFFETPRGILYMDNGTSAHFWQVGTVDRFPEPLAMPQGFIALGAGDDALLTAYRGMVATEITLHQMPLP